MAAWQRLLLLALPCVAASPISVARPSIHKVTDTKSFGEDSWHTEDGRRKQFVLACNGFADERPAFVGIRTEDFIAQEQDDATLHLAMHERGGVAHFLRAKNTSLVAQHRQVHHRTTADGAGSGERQVHHRTTLRGSADGAGSLHPELAKGGGAHRWATAASKDKARGGDTISNAFPVAYGSCQEYHVDLKGRRMFFVTPLSGSCLVSGDALSPMEETRDAVSQRFVLVLTQKSVGSPDCAVVGMSLDRGPGAGAREIVGHGGVSAELALVDAFIQDHPLVPYLEEDHEEDEEDHLQEPWELEEEKQGADLSLNAGSVVRLEDVMEKGPITQELLASRTLGLGQVYDVEPMEQHVILEDLRGSTMLDERDVTFEADQTYVGIRFGRAGNSSFPEKLGWFLLPTSSEPPKDPPAVPSL